MGDGEYFRFLREIFEKPTAPLTDFHRLLSQIPFGGAATSNYETLVERGFKDARPSESILVFAQTDYAQLGLALNSKEFFVLKAHGTIERPETIVLTEKDYATLIHNSPGYRTFLKALFLDRTVLFLGFGLNDPELRLLLEELREIFEGHTPLHYALLDVSGTTETEQKSFESQYAVRIIPYLPSANDHPEVIEFLREIIAKLPKHILAHTLTRGLTPAKNVLESDSHYKWVMNTEKEFELREKFPGASKEKPLKFTAELRFDTKKPEDQEAYEAHKKFLATGEPITIKSPHLAQFIPPEVVSLLMPERINEMELTMGPIVGQKSLYARAFFEANDGQRVILEGIEFKNIQSGTEQMILSNEHQTVPWKFRQVIRFDESQSQATITVHTVNVPITQAVKALKFCQALSKGGSLKIESVETDIQLSHANIAPGAFPTLDENWIRICKALDLIQKNTGTLFRSPEVVSPEASREIGLVFQILGTGRVMATEFPLDLTRDEAADFLAKVSEDKPLRLTNYADDFVSLVYGKRISLGPVFIACDKMYITPTHVREIERQIQSGNDTISVSLTPVEGNLLEARFPQWLPKDEASIVLDLPVVRGAALKNLINALFEAAKDSNGSVNVKELVALFDEARKASSEEGVLVNPLKTESFEAISTMIKTAASQLEDSVRDQVLEELDRKGWLRQKLPMNQNQMVGEE